MTQEEVTEQDLIFLRRAIELAREARSDGRHPFGSLIVNERGETVVGASRRNMQSWWLAARQADCCLMRNWQNVRCIRARNRAPCVPQQSTGPGSAAWSSR